MGEELGPAAVGAFEVTVAKGDDAIAGFLVREQVLFGDATAADEADAGLIVARIPGLIGRVWRGNGLGVDDGGDAVCGLIWCGHRVIHKVERYSFSREPRASADGAR